MKGFVRTAITYEDTPENQAIWKEAKMLALKDGWSLSRLMREALHEYIERHSPGNPQLILGHWNEKRIPLPQTLAHKHKFDRIGKIEGEYHDYCECGEHC